MFENVTQSYSGGDATLEIVIMLAVAFVLGFLLRHIFCKPGDEPARRKIQATEPTSPRPPSQPEPRPEESVATPLMARNSPSPAESDPEIEEKSPNTEESAVVAPVSEAPPPGIDSAAEDDLRKVDGIGPKIAGLLKDDGITTFASLAKADPARLKEILDAAGPRFRMHDPYSWPKQAALLAEGRLDELKALQASLKGQA